MPVPPAIWKADETISPTVADSQGAKETTRGLNPGGSSTKIVQGGRDEGKREESPRANCPSRVPTSSALWGGE